MWCGCQSVRFAGARSTFNSPIESSHTKDFKYVFDGSLLLGAKAVEAL